MVKNKVFSLTAIANHCDHKNIRVYTRVSAHVLMCVRVKLVIYYWTVYSEMLILLCLKSVNLYNLAVVRAKLFKSEDSAYSVRLRDSLSMKISAHK